MTRANILDAFRTQDHKNTTPQLRLRCLTLNHPLTCTPSAFLLPTNPFAFLSPPTLLLSNPMTVFPSSLDMILIDHNSPTNDALDTPPTGEETTPRSPSTTHRSKPSVAVHKGRANWGLQASSRRSKVRVHLLRDEKVADVEVLVVVFLVERRRGRGKVRRQIKVVIVELSVVDGQRLEPTFRE